MGISLWQMRSFGLSYSTILKDLIKEWHKLIRWSSFYPFAVGRHFVMNNDPRVASVRTTRYTHSSFLHRKDEISIEYILNNGIGMTSMWWWEILSLFLIVLYLYFVFRYIYNLPELVQYLLVDCFCCSWHGCNEWLYKFLFFLTLCIRADILMHAWKT